MLIGLLSFEAVSRMRLAVMATAVGKGGFHVR